MTEYAFPNGMTLRDYVAAKAMQSLLPDYQSTASFIAGQAYHYADAMLKARESQEAPRTPTEAK